MRLEPLILAATLVGCAAHQPTPRGYWDKPGATREMYEIDLAACELVEMSIPQQQAPAARTGTQAYFNALSAGDDARARYVRVMDACLKSKGWRLRFD